MKIFLVSLFVFITLNSVIAQNDPAPDYLLNHNIPDSVGNLSLIDMNGKDINFSDVLNVNKGKKVVIDIWASWCRDCIVGMTSLKKLQDKTNNHNVVYVFLSIDKDEKKWKAGINKYDIKGQHFRIPLGWKNPLTNYVKLDWIPRYIVVNEHGKIVVPKAITAKDEKLTKVLLN